MGRGSVHNLLASGTAAASPDPRQSRQPARPADPTPTRPWRFPRFPLERKHSGILAVCFFFVDLRATLIQRPALSQVTEESFDGVCRPYPVVHAHPASRAGTRRSARWGAGGTGVRQAFHRSHGHDRLVGRGRMAQRGDRPAPAAEPAPGRVGAALCPGNLRGAQGLPAGRWRDGAVPAPCQCRAVQRLGRAAGDARAARGPVR